MYNYSTNTGSSSSSEVKAKDKDQPLDTVSQIVWDPNRQDSTGFVCSSWDGYVRYYLVNTSKNELEKVWQFFLQHPVLCCDIGPNNIVFAGLASGDIMAVSLENSQCVHLGCHQAPISAIAWMKEFNCLMTLGFDNLINFWTLETNNNNNHNQLQFKLPYKTYTASFDHPYLLIGSSESMVTVINMRNMPNLTIPKEYTKVSLEKFSKFICSKISTRTKKIIMGTADGRCSSFDFIDNYELRFENVFVTRYQKKVEGRYTLYGQVDAVDLGVHNNEVFAIIGGTEEIGIYNLHKRTRSKMLPSGTNNFGAATAAKVCPNNKYIAVAYGTDWNKGLMELESLKKPKVIVYKNTSNQLAEFISR